MHGRRGRSPSSPETSRQCSHSPATGRSTAQDDETENDGACPRFLRLYDDQFHIRPWGFVNKATEEKFVEYHWLTFTTNYKGFIAKFFGAVALIQGVLAASQLFYDEDFLAVAMSLVRTAVCTAISVLFSGQKKLFIRRAWEFVQLVHFKGMMPFFYIVEFINPATSQIKVTIAVTCWTIFGFVSMPCSWRGMCWVYCMAFWVPAGIICRSTWEEQETHVRMMKRAQLLPIAGTVGPLICAIFSVDYRRCWAMASQQARRSRSSDTMEEDASGELLRRQGRSVRSASPRSRWAASEESSDADIAWLTQLGIARSRMSLRIVKEQDSGSDTSDSW